MGKVRTRWPIVLLLGFCVGAVADWRLSSRRPAAVVEAGPPIVIPRTAREVPEDAASSAPRAERGVGTSGAKPPLPTVRELPAVLEDLRGRGLRVPLDGSQVESWKGSFEQARAGHRHEAVDVLAPRGTPVFAVDDGSVGKLFESRRGGISVYQFDPWRRFVYYYAHLDRYAEGLAEGRALRRGEVIGYVGTTGNAPADTPHLHFAILALSPGEGWWQGTAVDPYLAYGGGMER